MVHQVQHNGQMHEFPDEATPEMMSKALGLSNKSISNENHKYNPEQMEFLKGLETKTTPFDLIKSGLIGMGKAGQNINESAYKLLGKKSPVGKENLNIQKTFGGKENPSTLENLIESIAQYSPQLATGGLGIPAEIAAGTAYGASQSPEDMLKGGLIGGGFSGASGLINKLMGYNSPILKAIGRSTAGAIPGYALGGAKGAAEGAALGFALPSIGKKLGILNKEHLGEEIVGKINPQEAEKRIAASERLGTPLTPGEASARPDITAMEAGIGKTGEAASERVKIGQERLNQQKEAIEKLFNDISPSENLASLETRTALQNSIEEMKKGRQEAVQPYYETAYNKKVEPNLIKKIKNEDKNISNAIDEAMSYDPYQVEGELLGVPENSIKVLDYAKRRLDAKIEQAENFGDHDAVRVLKNSKNRLLESIDRFSPDYKTARNTYNKLSEPIEKIENSQIGKIANLKDTNLKNVSKTIFDPSETDLSQLTKIRDKVISQNPEAWDSIVRNEMERLMTSGKNKGLTGRSFFDTVLSNDRRFKQFEAALEHNPKALSQLNDMKTAWEHLINIETPRTASGWSKTSMDKARASMQAIKDAWNEMLGTKDQIKALNYLYSDQWKKDLGKIKEMPKSSQKPLMVMLIGKTLAPSYFIDNKKENEPEKMTLELNKGYKE